MPTTIRHKSADGATVITAKNWGTIVSSALAEVDTARLKFTLENIADRALGGTPFAALVLSLQQVGVNDGFTFVDTAPDGNPTISKPWGAAVDAASVPTGGVTAVDSAAGGSWGSTGLKGVRVVALNGTGHTTGSNETTFNVGDTTRKWRYDWLGPTNGGGATGGYDVYVSNTPGDYSAARKQHVAAGTMFLVDDGSTGSTTAIPTDNTSGGAATAYGTPPSIGSFDNTDKTVASAPNGLAVGQEWFYWVVVKIPAGTSSVGNTRVSRRLPKEI